MKKTALEQLREQVEHWLPEYRQQREPLGSAILELAERVEALEARETRFGGPIEVEPGATYKIKIGKNE